MRVVEIVLRVVVVAVLVLCLGVPAFAAFQGPETTGAGGGATVQQVKNMADDTHVTLTGSIVSYVSGTDDKYIFRDASGEIVVEIDHKRFRGQTVTPADTVRITGEVDKDFGRAAEVDVKQIEVLK